MKLSNENFHSNHSIMVLGSGKECAPSLENGIENGKLILNQNS